MAENTRILSDASQNKKDIVGEGVGFERIRRITGYLVGTLDRFNNAKRAEVRDRVKHSAGFDGSADGQTRRFPRERMDCCK